MAELLRARQDGQWCPKANSAKNGKVSSYPEQRLRKTRTEQERGRKESAHLGPIYPKSPFSRWLQTLHSFPPFKFYSSLISSPLPERLEGTATGVFRRHNIASCSIQFPLSCRHHLFLLKKCSVEVCKINPNCTPLGIPSHLNNGTVVLKENINYPTWLSPVFQKRKLPLPAT